MILTECILSLVTAALVIIDIFLCGFIAKNVPLHVTRKGYYYQVDKETLPFKEAIGRCKCLHRAFPTGAKNVNITFKSYENADDDDLMETTTTPPIPPQVQQFFRRRRFVETEQDFSFVVAVLKRAFLDDKELRFACNGLLVTNKLVLVAKNCIEIPNNQERPLFIRSQSPYWSKHGNLHKVMRMKIFPKTLAILIITPAVKETGNYIKLPEKYPKMWTHVTSLGWHENMYQKSANQRRKFDKIQIKKINKHNNCGFNNVSRIILDESMESESVLVNSCSELVGFAHEIASSAHCNQVHRNCTETYENVCNYLKLTGDC